jgi:hypothetical protein
MLETSQGGQWPRQDQFCSHLGTELGGDSNTNRRVPALVPGFDVRLGEEHITTGACADGPFIVTDTRYTVWMWGPSNRTERSGGIWHVLGARKSRQRWGVCAPWNRCIHLVGAVFTHVSFGARAESGGVVSATYLGL